MSGRDAESHPPFSPGQIRPTGASAVIALTLASLSGLTGPSCGGNRGGGGEVDAGERDAHADASWPSDGGDPILPPADCPDPAPGSRIFYVDGENGDDGNDGLSETTAFRTVGRAVDGRSAPIGPGDAVLIKGGVYRERLVINNGGTDGQRVLIRSFDDTEVVIDASAEVTGWTLESGQIYRASPGFEVQAVVVDDVPLVPEFSVAALQEGFYHYDTNGGDLYVWAPGGGSPADRTVGVIEVDPDKIRDAIYIEIADYVTLCGVTVRFASARGIKILGNHNRVEQCRVRFNGAIGVTVGPWEQVESTDTEFVRNEIAYNFMRNWPRCAPGFKYGGWGTGGSSQRAPNTRFVGNIVHNNGGEGLVAYGGTRGTLFRDNVVFDNWSANIYVLNQQNARVENNIVYSHDPDLRDLTNNQDPDPSDNACSKRLRPDGIVTGDENLGSSNPTLLENVIITNNMIINCRRGFTHVNELDGSGIKGIEAYFNTIILPWSPHAFENPSGIYVPFNDGNNRGTVFRSNLVFGTVDGSYLLYGATDPNGTSDLFLGVFLADNLFFHAGNATPFRWGTDWSHVYNHADWLALPGAAHGEGDVYGDPGLIDLASFDPFDKCPGDSGSPAVDGAADLGVGEDFFHEIRPALGGFDFGACEFQ